MKKLLVIVFAFFFITTFNFSETRDKQNNSLSLNDLIQFNSAYATDETGDDGGSGGLDTNYIRNTNSCSITVYGEVGASVTIWGVTVKIPASGSISVTKSGQEIVCGANGTNTCSPRDC